MADRIWLGRAKSVAQVVTVQVTAYDAATTYALTINGKSVTAIAAGSANATATALAAAWNAIDDYAEFTAITASANTDTVTLTHDTEGVNFTVASSVSGGTGTIGAATTVTAATGPNHVSNVNNWSGGALPVDGDNIYIPGGTGASLLYDLDALDDVTPALVEIHAGFGALGETIGLPDRNAAGYTEYLEKYLLLDGATICRIGVGNGPGSSRIRINFQATAAAIEGITTGPSADANTPACTLIGTNASNTFEATNGTYGIALNLGEAATLTTARVGQNATVRFGRGTTLGTLTTSGIVEADCGTTALNQKDGTCSVNLAGAHTAIDVAGGQLNYNSSGTATAITIGPGRVECSTDISTRTWTTTTLRPGGSIFDPAGTITYTNKIAISSVKEIIASTN